MIKCFKRVGDGDYMAGVVILPPIFECGEVGITKLSVNVQLYERFIECRLCHELKSDSQYAPHRRQCNRCRNRYTEQVRDVEKRRAHQRVRDRRYRLKLREARCGIGAKIPICAQ